MLDASCSYFCSRHLLLDRPEVQAESRGICRLGYFIDRLRSQLPCRRHRESSSKCAEESQYSGSLLLRQGRRRSGELYTHEFVRSCWSMIEIAVLVRYRGPPHLVLKEWLLRLHALVSLISARPDRFWAERLQKETQPCGERLRTMIGSTVLSTTLLDPLFQRKPRTSSFLFAQIKAVLVAHVKPSIGLTARHVDRDQDDPGP